MAKIRLLEVFGNNIFTRRIISNFFEELKNMKENTIELDFSGIDFISRSCADEYVKQKKGIQKKIVEVNMSDNICSMFNVVKSQYDEKGISFSFKVCSNTKGLIPA